MPFRPSVRFRLAVLPGPAGRLVAGAAVALLPAMPAAAHTAGGGFVLLLPTGYWQAGGAAAVALSFAVLAGLPRPLFRPGRAAAPSSEDAASVASWLVLLLLAGLVLLGFSGPRDPLANLLPLTVWTVLWVGMTLLTALAGDLWRRANPWLGPLRLARRAGLPTVRLPEAVDVWPALILFLAFGWFELVALAPEDPAILAQAVVFYWAFTLVLALLFGREWLRRGEFLGAFWDLVARLSPRGPGGGWVLPGQRVVDSPALPLSGVLFVTTALATVSFDGLSRSYAWLGLIGVNPLDFPGRSAVQLANTAGYLACVAAMAAAFLGAVAAGRRLARPAVPFGVEVGRLALTLLPIALAYHAAHYLTLLLVRGQYWLAALADPLATGRPLWGAGQRGVTTSFLHTPAGVEAIWTAQALLIVAGHLLAVALAHAVHLDLHGGCRRAAALGGLPLAVLMVLYTLLGLWLLATPAGA